MIYTPLAPEEVVLYPPQELAAQRGAHLKRAPVLGTMGSGKTLTAIKMYEWGKPNWEEATRHSPAVVLCRTNAMATWLVQLSRWLGIPQSEIAYAHGSTKVRHRIWREALAGKYRFVITTPRSFCNDAKNNVIPKHLDLFWDEYHHDARSRTKTWELICSWTLHSDIVIPLSGTPLRRGPQDMFPVLHLCNRKRFPRYWQYVNTWCVTMQSDFGKEIIGPKNMQNFREEIYGKYCAYMPKKETDKYLPKKDRQFIVIDPSPFQRKAIERIYEQVYLETSDEAVTLLPNQMTKILRERQLLVTPKLLDPSWEYGAGFEALKERLEDLDTPRPVIFTDFAEAVPILAEYLQNAFRKRNVWELRGGLKPEELHARVKAHNESEDDITICSLQYAESFEYPRSQTCFVLGFNWSKDVCEQAEDRLRRAISEYSNIKCFYFQYLNTVEGDVLARLYQKDAAVKSVTPEQVYYSIQRHRGG